MRMRQLPAVAAAAACAAMACALACVLAMAAPAAADDVLLGHSVGAKHDGTRYAANDTSVFLRGQRDFLLYKRAGEGRATFRVERRDGAETHYGTALACTVRSYRMADLPDDPGAPVDVVARIGPRGRAVIDLTDARYPPGLYRFRVEPNRDAVLYQVRVDGLQYYAEEAWEPRFNPYFFGRDLDAGPIVRSFFVPAGAGTVRLKLETSGLARARVIQVTGGAAGDTVLTLAAYGARATGDSSAAFASGTFAAATDDPSGQLYRIELSNPLDAGAGDHPVGDTWFRFSRNVPPYFAEDPRRLLVPVVHRETDPVVYRGQAIRQRAYLCLERTALPGRARLQTRVGDAADTTSTGYRVQLRPAAPAVNRKLPATARLISAGGLALAASTDKVDTVYVVQEPAWEAWPDPLYVMYDDRNGDDAAQVVAGTQYRTIQCDRGHKLEANFSDSVQAMGALYSGDMDSVFAAAPDHPKVRFWKLADEPDRGPGAEGPVRRLRAVYADYFARKSRPTHKPLAVNVSHALVLAEYGEGADVIATDPYVRRRAGYAGQPRIVVDWARELERIAAGPDAGKRTMLVLWAWAPPHPGTVVDSPQVYGDAWRLLVHATGVDAVATFKWGNAARRLTDFDEGRWLWTEIQRRWSAPRD